jgi:hypothetical protein
MEEHSTFVDERRRTIWTSLSAPGRAKNPAIALTEGRPGEEDRRTGCATRERVRGRTRAGLNWNVEVGRLPGASNPPRPNAPL